MSEGEIHELHNEKELLLQIVEGDEDAFSQIFRAYHQKLGDHIYRLTEDREMTKDIVQEVFLKIWMIRESLAEVRSFKPWLYRISRNSALNALRKIARQRIIALQPDDAFPLNDIGHSDEPYLLDIVDDAVAALSPQQQKVYMMSRHQGKRYQDIALEMGISQETVKYYMKLALASIVKSIKQQAGLSCALWLISRI